MNVTLSIDDRLVEQARKRAEALGKSLNQMVRDYLQSIVNDDDVERDMDELRKLSGTGNRHGWKFNRDEIHERRP